MCLLLGYFLDDSDIVPVAPLLLVSLLFLYFTPAIFLLWGLYIIIIITLHSKQNSGLATVQMTT